MKKILIGLSLVFFLGTLAEAQIKPFNPNDIEIGIVEKLDSILPAELVFQNEAGEDVTLGELINKPTILSFVYYDCPGACGPLLSGLADAISKLDMELGVDYDVLTFSFDPKDTPPKSITEKNNFVQEIPMEKRQHWKFLTSDQETIYKITDAVGWRYKKAGLDFGHPSAIMVTSPERKLTRYLFGMSFLPFNVKMALIEAQDGKSRPTINKVLEFCFTYDPQGREYTLQITRLVGSITIIIALVIFITLLIRGRRKPVK